MRAAAMLVLLAVSVSVPRAGCAQTPEQWSASGRNLYAASRYRESIAAFERALQLRVDASDDGAWYIARSYAQIGNKKQALRWLAHARQLGFNNAQAIRDEPAFEKYHGERAFRALVTPSSCSSCDAWMRFGTRWREQQASADAG